MRRVIWKPLIQFLRATFFETLGATLLTAPLVATVFGQFSLVAPLANLLIVGWVAPFMLLGLLFLVIGWAPIVPSILTPLVLGIGRLVIALVDGLAAVPFSSIVVARSGLLTACAYVLIALWLYRPLRSSSQSPAAG